MENSALLKHYRAGDAARFAAQWARQEPDMVQARSWLSWLVRDTAQRADKLPGDLIHGGIQRAGSPSTQEGPFIEIVVGHQASMLSEGALVAWVNNTQAPISETRARVRRLMGLFDRLLPGMGRTEASKVLGAYLRADLQHDKRKALLVEMTPERLAGWNKKAILRLEHLVEHSGWHIERQASAEEAIALVDVTLDRLGDLPRFVRTDIVPGELLKAMGNTHRSPAQGQAIAHLLSRTAHLFKPQVQAALAQATRAPQVEAYMTRPTPKGLLALAQDTPDLGFEAKRGQESLVARTLRAYARTVAEKGATSPQATAWESAFAELSVGAIDKLRACLAGVIEDVVEDMVDRSGTQDRQALARAAKPLVLALRKLHPQAPLAERSWAELAITGALLDPPKPRLDIPAKRQPK